VLIFSGHANDSGQVRREVERAISQGMTVLPVRIEDVHPEGAMEYALGNTHWLDAFAPPVERQVELLARSVKTLLGEDVESADPAPTKPAAVAPAKWPGVAPARRPPWAWPLVVAGVLMVGLFAAWMGGVFKVKSPDGVIVLENGPLADQPEMNKASAPNAIAGEATVSPARKQLVKSTVPTTSLAVTEESQVWEAKMRTDKGELIRLIAHLERNDAGMLIATLDSPDQSVKGLKVDAVTLNDETLAFEIRRLAAKFSGKIGHGGTVAIGEWEQGGKLYALTFEKQ
jgi:hypothetical protein